ncbi:MAG: tRNA (adenosine(37)-N6)-threonylcarbamoyltransferase complex transferase subunit TsaD [Chloroflexota bacterium]
MSRILAIETSCDETAAAVIENGRVILSNVVATQIDLHRRFGGIFPEVASRQHVLSIYPVIQQALDEAGVTNVQTLDSIAVTHGPGLSGSLLVGVNAAKGLAFASDLPLHPINHLAGHIYSNWLDDSSPHLPALPNPVNGDSLLGEGTIARADGADESAVRVSEQDFPMLILIVSGGHTELILMHGHGRYERLGGTLDDAAGEAFDKVARLLDLGFPGGPIIQEAAQKGDPTRFALPKPLWQNPDHRYNFSFSGLKTAVLNLTRQLEKDGQSLNSPELKADIAASFQQVVTEVLVAKCADAATAYAVRRVCLCGGVSANAQLRKAAEERFQALNIPLTIPPIYLCTDNAAMIGAAAHFLDLPPEANGRGLSVDVYANLPL